MEPQEVSKRENRNQKVCFFGKFASHEGSTVRETRIITELACRSNDLAHLLAWGWNVARNAASMNVGEAVIEDS
jgi:hypothetical protein